MCRSGIVTLFMYFLFICTVRHSDCTLENGGVLDVSGDDSSFTGDFTKSSCLYFSLSLTEAGSSWSSRRVFDLEIVQVSASGASNSTTVLEYFVVTNGDNLSSGDCPEIGDFASAETLLREENISESSVQNGTAWVLPKAQTAKDHSCGFSSQGPLYLYMKGSGSASDSYIFKYSTRPLTDDAVKQCRSFWSRLELLVEHAKWASVVVVFVFCIGPAICLFSIVACIFGGVLYKRSLKVQKRNQDMEMGLIAEQKKKKKFKNVSRERQASAWTTINPAAAAAEQQKGVHPGMPAASVYVGASNVHAPGGDAYLTEVGTVTAARMKSAAMTSSPVKKLYVRNSEVQIAAGTGNLSGDGPDGASLIRFPRDVRQLLTVGGEVLGITAVMARTEDGQVIVDMMAVPEGSTVVLSTLPEELQLKRSVLKKTSGASEMSESPFSAFYTPYAPSSHSAEVHTPEPIPCSLVTPQASRGSDILSMSPGVTSPSPVAMAGPGLRMPISPEVSHEAVAHPKPQNHDLSAPKAMSTQTSSASLVSRGGSGPDNRVVAQPSPNKMVARPMSTQTSSTLLIAEERSEPAQEPDAPPTHGKSPGASKTSRWPGAVKKAKAMAPQASSPAPVAKDAPEEIARAPESEKETAFSESAQEPDAPSTHGKSPGASKTSRWPGAVKKAKAMAPQASSPAPVAKDAPEEIARAPESEKETAFSESAQEPDAPSTHGKSPGASKTSRWPGAVKKAKAMAPQASSPAPVAKDAPEEVPSNPPRERVARSTPQILAATKMSRWPAALAKAKAMSAQYPKLPSGASGNHEQHQQNMSDDDEFAGPPPLPADSDAEDEWEDMEAF